MLWSASAALFISVRFLRLLVLSFSLSSLTCSLLVLMWISKGKEILLGHWLFCSSLISSINEREMHWHLPRSLILKISFVSRKHSIIDLIVDFGVICYFDVNVLDCLEVQSTGDRDFVGINLFQGDLYETFGKNCWFVVIVIFLDRVLIGWGFQVLMTCKATWSTKSLRREENEVL